MQTSDSQLILVVDDNPVNLEVMSVALGDAGYDVAIATSGERAIKQMQRIQPDLILLDIMMPGMNGFETCQVIREKMNLTHIPIMFMTALADTDNKVKGLKLGGVDYITKPFQEVEVLARVKTHLSLRETERQLRQSEEHFENILSSLEEVVWSATFNPINFLYMNPAVEQIFGYTVQEIKQKPYLWFDIVHADDKEYVYKLFETFKVGKSINLEYRINHPTGTVRWIKLRAQKILDPARENGYRIDGILHDISKQKHAESQLIHEAHHDSLTGLLNRSSFISHTNKQLELVQEFPEQNFSILFVDLDRFKHINDSLGHHIGDQLLIKVAERIQASLRPYDTVARLGSDEFTILLKHMAQTSDIIRVVERIQKKLSSPIKIDNQMFYISASIGIVIADNHYSVAEELLRDADIAMYQAKKHGKAGWQVFNQSMYDDSLYQLELEQDLRIALNLQQITLQYQPIVNVLTQELIGFEALARWIHPQKGFIPPAEFIPVAEESGLIEPLGEEILWQACRQLKQWNEQYPESIKYKMSINLSGKQFFMPQFIDKLDQILADTGISGDQLKLEITESILIDNHEILLTLLNDLIDRKITLSLDDFGTGYSSLSYLHSFPLNELKIDRSFINRVETDQQSKEIVKTIVTLARSLNMGVVAEGVETLEQQQYLKDLNCDVAQGYLFSKPLTPADAEVWLSDRPTINPDQKGAKALMVLP